MRISLVWQVVLRRFTAIVALSAIAGCSPPEDMVAAEQPEGEILGLSRLEFEYRVREAAAEQGTSDDKVQLFLFVHGERPKLDAYLPSAIDSLRDAAADSHVDASYLLGHMYVVGDVIEKDLDKGIAWLTQAAESGHHHAAYLAGSAYGEIYTESKEAGRAGEAGTAFRQAEALWSKMIRDRSVPDELSFRAQRRLALLYIEKDPVDVRGWDFLFELAVQGYEPAVATLRRYQAVFETNDASQFEEIAPTVRRLDEFLLSLDPQE